MKTLFDCSGTVASTMLKTGILPIPALIANAVIGPVQMLYMNHEGFRHRVDGLIDRVSGVSGASSRT